MNVHVPGRGYVAIGTTLADARRLVDAAVRIDGTWVRLADQPLIGSYSHGSDGAAASGLDEYVVPVEWHVAVPASDAYWEKGMFANQNSACKLRQEFTLQRLAERFELAEDA